MPLYSQKAMDSPYWNEYLECMPREKLNELHLRRLKGLIKYAYENVTMYKEIYDEAGVRPEDINTLDDYVKKLPAIDKKDVLACQSRRPPYGEAIVRGSEDYISLFYMTSGTTGRPLMEPGYFKDIQQQWTHQWWAHGIRSSDVFYIAFPFGTFMGFWSAYFDAILLGAQVISSGGQDSKGRIRQIVELKPTVLVATPTYIRHLAEIAREMGVDPASTSVKYLTVAAEKITTLPHLREEFETTWAAKALEIFGISELWGAASFSCPNHPERLHLSESSGFGIVVDEKGDVVSNGGRGEFILTSYNPTVMPLIKYRTHDVVEGHFEGCDCGRTWLWLQGGVLGRTDQMLKIKGTNVYPDGIEAILGEIKGLSGNLEIHVTSEEDGDAVSVKIEPKEGVPAGEYEALGRKAREELKAKIGVSIWVEIVPPKSLPRYEVKGKKVIDHRVKK
ncbi:MAG: phenylacetate--CoA ligase family protein [Clostridia bacterium]|nr:MAG: phenylacetate--CoA ligase family protein [Clostridia bacterium]